jgi:hypothetical protein
MTIFHDAASVAKALAIQIAAGFPMAGKEEQFERHQICQGCKLFNKEEYKCNECHCYLQLKIPLGTSECPKGYWGKIGVKKDE